jgi:DNA-binding NtrC family response regulator
MAKDNAFSSQFSGKRVLVVEDEYLLADETRARLQRLGATVVGPTNDVEKALHLILEQKVDVAILDIYLDGELVFPVADKLEELAIPYVFATGHDSSIVPALFTGYVLSEKPIDLENIAKALFDRGEKRSH